MNNDEVELLALVRVAKCLDKAGCRNLHRSGKVPGVQPGNSPVPICGPAQWIPKCPGNRIGHRRSRYPGSGRFFRVRPAQGAPRTQSCAPGLCQRRKERAHQERRGKVRAGIRQRFETRTSFIVVGDTWPSIPTVVINQLAEANGPVGGGAKPLYWFMIRVLPIGMVRRARRSNLPFQTSKDACYPEDKWSSRLTALLRSGERSNAASEARYSCQSPIIPAFLNARPNLKGDRRSLPTDS